MLINKFEPVSIRGLHARTALAYARIEHAIATQSIDVPGVHRSIELEEYACAEAFALGLVDARNEEYSPPAMFADPTATCLLNSWQAGQVEGKEVYA